MFIDELERGKGTTQGHVKLSMSYHEVVLLNNLLSKCRDDGYLDSDDKKQIKCEFATLHSLLGDGCVYDAFTTNLVSEIMKEKEVKNGY